MLTAALAGAVRPQREAQPSARFTSSILAMGALSAAVLSYLPILGIKVERDHGLLFAMGVVTLTCGSVVTFIHRFEIPNYTTLITQAGNAQTQRTKTQPVTFVFLFSEVPAKR